MISFPTLLYSDGSNNSQSRYYSATISPDSSGLVRLPLNGTDINGSPVRAKFLTIDNTANASSMKLRIGAMTTYISAYNAITIPLPGLGDYADFSNAFVAFDIILSEKDLGIPNQDNSYSGIVQATPAPGASTLETDVVTVANSGTTWGFSSGTFGACAPPGSIIYPTHNIFAMEFETLSNDMIFAILGSVSNLGWTTLTVNGYAFSRAAATFTPGGSATIWQWTSGVNPFGTTIGALITCKFT